MLQSEHESNSNVGCSTAVGLQLQAERISVVAFAPFGQLVGPTDDAKDFDANDAQLNLSNGIPR